MNGVNMKKLLLATAMTAVMTSGAFANSILEKLIQDADNLAANMLNLSENFANVSATSNLTLPEGFFDFMTTDIDLEGIFSASGLITSFEPAATADGAVAALEISFADPADVIAALRGQLGEKLDEALGIGDVTTTAIGALNTGRIGDFRSGFLDDDLDAVVTSVTGVTVDATRVASISNAYTSNTGAFNATFSDPGLTNLANLAGNYSATTTSVSNVNVAGLVNVGDVSTTAIGSLNTGDIAANVTGAVSMNLAGAWCVEGCILPR
jgi:hypothetical protein